MRNTEAKNKAEFVESNVRAPAKPTVEPIVDDTAHGDETRPNEVGGRGGLDPTRYGDWEKAGRCIDF